ncbi:MAG TPA: site-specific integrase [Armatimonadota bacterium]|nr:site-specific integrase [Armatimonadota bacterium]
MARAESLPAMLDQAEDYMRAAVSANTEKAYRTDWRHFVAWCEFHDVDSLPATPAMIAVYITDQAKESKPSTISRRLSSISVAHRAAGHQSPTRSELVRKTLKGIRRTLGVAPTRKAPVRADHLREIAPKLGDTLQEVRDKAILLVGYAGAFRRSELAALTVDDLTFVAEGVRVLVRRSKTDQEGEGQVKGIGHGMNAVTCPVKALQAWMEVARITSGPVFRAISRHGHISDTGLSDRGIALVVKRIAKKLGVDPAAVGGHSLRAGFVTDQYARGTAEGVIMQQTGHKSRAVLAQYRREADAFAFNFTAAAGL